MNMSITLKDTNPVADLAKIVDGLVREADYSLAKLHHFQETDAEHPSIADYEPLAAGYFALAVQSQELVSRLATLEVQTVPPTLLQRVSPEMRTELLQLARKHGHVVTEETLASIPFVPGTDRHPTSR